VATFGRACRRLTGALPVALGMDCKIVGRQNFVLMLMMGPIREESIAISPSAALEERILIDPPHAMKTLSILGLEKARQSNHHRVVRESFIHGVRS